MDSFYFWTTVIPLAIGTLIIRLSFIFIPNLKMNAEIEKLFSFIPAAVLPALFIPMVFISKNNPENSFDLNRVLAFGIGTIFCFYTKSVLMTIVIGVSCLVFFNIFF